MGSPLWKKSQFFDFWTSCFYSLQRRFFVLEYRKRLLPSLYCLKKSRKNGHFGPKPGVNPFWKSVNFSTFWRSCFYSLERRFSVVEYRKRHFPSRYCLKKKKFEKRPFLDQNHGLTTFRKMSIFPLF